LPLSLRFGAVAAAIGAAAASALAAALPGPAAAGPVGPCAGVFVSAAALTDYRFDGFSESDRAPTWQATLYCYRADGWFAGTTLTGVDFEDRPRTWLEVDWYGGRQLAWRNTKLTLDLLYASFPDKRAPGPGYDIVEPQADLSRPFGRLTLDGAAGWQTDISGRGDEWRLRAGALYALAPWLSVSGHLGQFLGAVGADHDHAFYDVGATATWRRLSLDVRYGGSTLPVSECYFTRWCEPGVYAALTWRLSR
jgi:uncharacterized protein (TIGR02001 family)